MRTSPEQLLFKAIILQAFRDLNNPAINRETRAYKLLAINFLLGASIDLKFICSCADIQVSTVQKAAKRILDSGMKFRAAPGTGPRYTERRARRSQKDKDPYHWTIPKD